MNVSRFRLDRAAGRVVLDPVAPTYENGQATYDLPDGYYCVQRPGKPVRYIEVHAEQIDDVCYSCVVNGLHQSPE